MKLAIGKRGVVQSIRLLSTITFIAFLAGCGGGSSTSVTAATAEAQYVPRLFKIGDERVFQYTDTYNDGNVYKYTQKRVWTQVNPDGSSIIQVFDANNTLIGIDTIDSNHILSTAAISPTGTRTCTDEQPRPAFAIPHTIGESLQGSYTGNCTPDGLTVVIQVSGRIDSTEKVALSGADYTALKEMITTGTTVTYPVSGSTTSYSYTQAETDWNDTDLGIIVRSDFTRTYTGNAPAFRLLSRSRILVSYVNK